MSKGVVNGELQVSVTHVERSPGGKSETLVKKEDTQMAESNEGEIKNEDGMPTEAQKSLSESPAVVSVGKKLTMNIGNFESVSVSVHLSMPCKPEKESINSMFDKVNTWVDRRVEVERGSVRRAQNGG